MLVKVSVKQPQDVKILTLYAQHGMPFQSKVSEAVQ